jgi:hypothetical protein
VVVVVIVVVAAAVEVDSINFQQDGASAHSGATVDTALYERIPGRWIGRGDPINWSPRRPDLTPMDFFFWA